MSSARREQTSGSGEGFGDSSGGGRGDGNADSTEASELESDFQAKAGASTGLDPDPSRFKGPRRPVEQVSWEDCQRFLQIINQQVQSLDLRLPTEAEWEYACRARTTTPFSFGDTITPEQVNYNGNFPYAGGAKGLYREETVDVASLPANGWGLYELHGNAFEWCEDWYGEYSQEAVANPRGASGGGRVIRGGSWSYRARYARSAQRLRFVPGIRYDSLLGFRFARGPK